VADRYRKRLNGSKELHGTAGASQVASNPVRRCAHNAPPIIALEGREPCVLRRSQGSGRSDIGSAQRDGRRLSGAIGGAGGEGKSTIFKPGDPLGSTREEGACNSQGVPCCGRDMDIPDLRGHCSLYVTQEGPTCCLMNPARKNIVLAAENVNEKESCKTSDWTAAQCY